MFGTPPRTNLTTVSVFQKIKFFFKKPFGFSRKERKVRTFWEILSFFHRKNVWKSYYKNFSSWSDFENDEILSQKHPCNFAVNPKVQAFWEFLSNNTSWDPFYKNFARKGVFENLLEFFSKNISSYFPKNPFFERFKNF